MNEDASPAKEMSSLVSGPHPSSENFYANIILNHCINGNTDFLSLNCSYYYLLTCFKTSLFTYFLNLALLEPLLELSK